MAFEDYRVVRFAADADTPADLYKHVGREVLVPLAQTIPTTYDPVGVAGVPGYGRTASDGVQEWVMAGSRDELMQHINRLPARGQWNDTEARQVWRQTFRDLRSSSGLSVSELRSQASALMRAAEADIAAPPP